MRAFEGVAAREVGGFFGCVPCSWVPFFECSGLDGDTFGSDVSIYVVILGNPMVQEGRTWVDVPCVRPCVREKYRMFGELAGDVATKSV